MAGGYSEQKIRYDYNYYYPYQYRTFETQNAVKFLFFSSIIIFIVQILDLTSGIIQSILFTDFENILTGIFIFEVLNSVSGLLNFIFIVLLVISVYMFHRGKNEFGQQHQVNILWAKKFIIGYFIIFIIAFFIALYMVATMLLIDQLFYIPPYYSGISWVITILLNFFLAFLLLYMVKEIASPRERDLMYIFTGLMILLPLIQAIVEMSFNYQFISGGSNSVGDTYYTRIIFFDLCYIINWALAVYTFYNISKRFDNNDFKVPDMPGKFLPRYRSISKHIYHFYSKPNRTLIAVIIVAIIVGAGVSVSAQVAQDQIFERSSEYSEDLVFEPGEYHISDNGIISEGESIDIDIPVDCDLILFEVYLYWSDEPDLSLRENEPDTFSLKADLEGDSKSDSDTNPHNGEGEIGLSWYFDEYEPCYVDLIFVTITLQTAGDQTGPVGLPRSPIMVEDNSNEFYFEVYYIYLFD
jgi:hypothetical protein